MTEVLPGESCFKVFLRCELNISVRFAFIAVVSRDPNQAEAPFHFFPPPPATPHSRGRTHGGAAYLGAAARTAAPLGSLRPLGGAFTVQVRLRQQSMEQFRKK